MEAAQPERYVAVPVSCSACKEKQLVHIRARAGGVLQMRRQEVECLKCDTVFEVMVPDEIIAGPFPAEP